LTHLTYIIILLCRRPDQRDDKDYRRDDAYTTTSHTDMTTITTNSPMKTTSNDKIKEILSKVRQDLSQLNFAN
jgi:hypothetical protein